MPKIAFIGKLFSEAAKGTQVVVWRQINTTFPVKRMLLLIIT